MRKINQNQGIGAPVRESIYFILSGQARLFEQRPKESVGLSHVDIQKEVSPFRGERREQLPLFQPGRECCSCSLTNSHFHLHLAIEARERVARHEFVEVVSYSKLLLRVRSDAFGALIREMTGSDFVFKDYPGCSVEVTAGNEGRSWESRLP